MNMRDYPMLHLDTNKSDGTALLLFYYIVILQFTVTVGSALNRIKCFDLECICWRLFQEHVVHIKLDIYVCIMYITPSQQFFSDIMARTSYIQRNEDDVRFVLDQHA
jgi:hypothetical protein